ncbi:MAG: helix-turn-helix domain-containing protein [Spirochaetia bacterium]
MLVAVRKPHIKVSVNGIGAALVIREILAKYPKAEVTTEDEAVDITTTDWWKKMQSTSHTGTVLRTYRDNAGLTLDRLSKRSGIAKSHLSDMENGKRAIGTRTAKKLSTALKVDYRLFL